MSSREQDEDKRECNYPNKAEEEFIKGFVKWVHVLLRSKICWLSLYQRAQERGLRPRSCALSPIYQKY